MNGLKKLLASRRFQWASVLIAALILVIYYLAPRPLIAPFLSQEEHIIRCDILCLTGSDSSLSVSIQEQDLAQLLALLDSARIQFRGPAGAGSPTPSHNIFQLSFLDQKNEVLGYCVLSSDGKQFAEKNTYQILGEEGEAIPALLQGFFEEGPLS